VLTEKKLHGTPSVTLNNHNPLKIIQGMIGLQLAIDLENDTWQPYSFIYCLAHLKQAEVLQSKLQ